MSSQLPGSLSDSSQQVDMDDMNFMLAMNERQFREVRARMYGVPEAVVSAWNLDDEDATSNPDESEFGVFDDSQLHGIASIPNNWSSRPSRARAMQSTSARVGNTVRQPSGPSQRDRDMRSLIKAFAEGWHSGIKELLSTEFTNHNLPRQHLSQLSCHTYLMLISMEQAVFEGLLHGTLGHQYHADPSTRRALDRLNSRVQHTSQPGIYWQSILSPDGYAPTPAQTIEVLDIIEKLYLQPVVETDAGTGLGAILAIDGVKLPHTSAHEARMGLRKYLFKTSQQGKRVMSRARVDRLQLFCRRLRRRIQCVPSKYHGKLPLNVFLCIVSQADQCVDHPLKEPLVEVGYTMQVLKRLACHRAHQSSNFIMNLFEAVCSYLFPGQFRLQQHTIFLIYQPIHGSLFEIVANRLSQGTIFNAGGFTFYPAGRSNATVNRYSLAAYKEWKEWAWQHTNLQANHAAYMKHLKESHVERSSMRAAHSIPAADEGGDEDEIQSQVRATASADRPLPTTEHSDQRTDRVVDMTKEDLQRLTASFLDRLRDIRASLDASMTSA